MHIINKIVPNYFLYLYTDIRTACGDLMLNFQEFRPSKSYNEYDNINIGKQFKNLLLLILKKKTKYKKLFENK